MDQYTIAPPAGSTNNSVGAADRPWKSGHFDSVKLNGGDLGEYLAESTGYGIVSGCAPTISGLTVTVGAGVVHLADGTRKEISSSTVTLDAADSTNPRIDLVYITSTGEVAKITGTAAASPSAPTLPSGGISVAQVSVAANATAGTLTDMRGMLARWYNSGVVNVRDFGAVGDGVTDDTSAFESAISAAVNNTLFIPNGNYKINSTLIANKAKTVVNNGNYTGVEPIYPIGDNLSKMALNLTPEIQINYPSAAEPTSTVSYYCQSAGYCPDTDHVLLVFAGYTIATGANDQPGKVVEMTADYQTVINSANVDVGHGNGCCYCSKDGKWYIATGTGVISLNSDLSLNSTHLTGSGWTVEYSSDKDVFYVQIGNTGSDNNGKVNIYSYDWELLSQTTLERVKNRYKTGYLTSQDATLINGDYVFLYYGAQDISLTTYDMLTGKIKEHAIFDNVTSREPEGIYVRQNQVYIVSVTSSNLLIYKCLLNNVANIGPYRMYAPGEQIDYINIATGHVTSGGTQIWIAVTGIPTVSGRRFYINSDQVGSLIVRQNGNYIINLSNASLSDYKIERAVSRYWPYPTSAIFTIEKQDGTAFTGVTNNDVCAVHLELKLTVD